MAKRTSSPSRARLSGTDKFQTDFIARIAPESHFHIALNHLANTRVVVKNAAGRFVWVSDNMPGRHGFASAADMVGVDDSAFNPPRLVKAYRRDDLQVLRTGQPLLEKVELAFDERGILTWCVTNKHPLRDRRGKVIGLVITLQDYSGSQGLPIFDDDVRAVVEYVLAHLGQRLSVPELAVKAGVSARQLERRFRGATGTSPTGFILRARLGEACRRLRASNEPIHSIAIDVGFYDQSAFTRLFHKHLGVTPSQFRHCRHQPVPAADSHHA